MNRWTATSADSELPRKFGADSGEAFEQLKVDCLLNIHVEVVARVSHDIGAFERQRLFAADHAGIGHDDLACSLKAKSWRGMRGDRRGIQHLFRHHIPHIPANGMPMVTP